jgi:hypothetical protein
MRRILANAAVVLAVLGLCASVALAAQTGKPHPIQKGEYLYGMPNIGTRCIHPGTTMPMDIGHHAVMVTSYHYEDGHLDNKIAVSIVQYKIGTNVHWTLENDWIHPNKCGWTMIQLNVHSLTNRDRAPLLCEGLDKHFQALYNGDEPKLNRPGAAPCPYPRLINGIWYYEFLYTAAQSMGGLDGNGEMPAP